MKTFFAALMAYLSFPLAAEASDAGAAAAFRIIWRDQPIGYHVVRAEETAQGLRVETRIEMRIKFGPIQLYRYSHQALEIWRGGELVSISSTTNDDGEEMTLAGWRENGVLMVEGDAYQGPVPEGAAPSSWWNKALLEAKIILDTQNGELHAVRVDHLGRTQAPHGGLAEHYRMTGTASLDLWFDGPRWVGSRAVVDGEKLTFKPITEGSERRRLLAMLR